MISSYSEKEIDILKEIINIGGGHVATGLSKMFEKRVDMEVPIINQMEYEEVFENIRPAEQIVKAVQVQISDELDGQFLLIMDEVGIAHLDETYSQVLENNDELARSAVLELANILVNQFLQAIAQLLEINVQVSLPKLAEDMFGSLLASAYLEEFQYDDKVWIFKNQFLIKDKKWGADLFFVPKPGVFEELINRLD